MTFDSLLGMFPHLGPTHIVTPDLFRGPAQCRALAVIVGDLRSTPRWTPAFAGVTDEIV